MTVLILLQFLQHSVHSQLSLDALMSFVFTRILDLGRRPEFQPIPNTPICYLYFTLQTLPTRGGSREGKEDLVLEGHEGQNLPS